MTRLIKSFIRGEEGASAAEYALLLALISGAIALAVTGLGTAITGAITTATGNI
jgi:Flp pilus assembly pilin Flp